MNIDKDIEILKSGLITKQEQIDLAAKLQTIKKIIRGLVERITELEEKLNDALVAERDAFESGKVEGMLMERAIAVFSKMNDDMDRNKK